MLCISCDQEIVPPTEAVFIPVSAKYGLTVTGVVHVVCYHEISEHMTTVWSGQKRLVKHYVTTT